MRSGGGAFDVEPANAAARRQCLAERWEFHLRRDRPQVADLQPVTQIRLVTAVTQHGVGVGQTRKRRGEGDAEALLENVGDQPFDDAEHVVDLDERHFEVELRELRLAVGAQVLVAQASGVSENSGRSRPP